ncbi:MAG TPA: hypothetical protein VFN88_01285 [Caulobacteraceae bacterium]|nr:hypothetical protein [Caulobacteraceae bacterium]
MANAAPPPPSPAPPAAGGYPAGVAAAGLQAVFDLKVAAGPVRPLTAALPGALPAGWTTIVSGQYGSIGGGTIADVDGAEADLYLNGGAYGIDNFKLSDSDGTLYLLALGHANNGGLAADLTLSNGLVEHISTTAGDCNKILVGAGSSLTATKVRFAKINGRSIYTFGDTALTDCYFESQGQNPGPDDHNECVYYHQGEHAGLRVFFDARQMAGRNTHATGQIFVDADAGDLVVRYRDVIFAGAAGIGMLSPIQIAAAPGFSARLEMDNCVIQAGTSESPGGRYCLPVGGTTTIICSHCRDYDSGDIIDAAVTAVAP